MSTQPRIPIALVGIMGAGKTTVARLLAERLGVTSEDLDARLEAEEGRTVTDLFEGKGESWFRRREALLLRTVLAEEAQVIACGGGIVCDAANRALLRERCDTVWLEVTPRCAARRLKGQTAMRPLLKDRDAVITLARLLEERAGAYAEVAVLRVATDGRTDEDVVQEIVRGLAVRGA